MAYWQYSFWAIPERGLRHRYDKIPEKISEIEFNSIDWFNGYSESALVETIDYLSPSSHWSKRVDFWGDYEGDSVAIDYESDERANPCEICFRIDMRKPYARMASKMMESIRAAQLIIFDSDLRLIDHDLECFVRSLGHLRGERLRRD